MQKPYHHLYLYNLLYDNDLELETFDKIN